jgi:hypothetical protein
LSVTAPTAPAASAPPDPAIALEAARRRRDDAAMAHQTKRRYFAVIVALLGPLAVIALAAHWLADETGPARSLAIAVEAALLLVALVIGGSPLGQWHPEWVKNRLRAELLRREILLLHARVGPYLLCEGDALLAAAHGRLAVLDHDHSDPVPLIALGDVADGAWRDALEDADRAGASVPAPDLRSAIQRYVAERVAAQREYFAEATTRTERYNRLYEYAVRIVLALALACSLIHLAEGALAHGHSAEAMASWIVVIALSLPAFGTALMALHALFEHHRLARAYAHTACALAESERAFHELLPHAQQPASQLRFKRLVLRVEQVLAQDLFHWWLIIDPEYPRPA